MSVSPNPPTRLPNASAEISSQTTNAVAIAGAVFCIFSGVLYAVLFYMVAQLPTYRPDLELLKAKTPTLIRLLMIGGSAGLLNLVALVLSAVGLLVPGRRREVAIVGTIMATFLLLGIGSVFLMSLLG